MSLSPCCRPLTACQHPPCSPYCIPPPPYYYQTPCTSYPFPPCTPCYPPPPVCQQPCNPPSCCPPPPCKPCMPKSACCGGGGVSGCCRSNGTTPIISLERRAQISFGGCAPSPNSGGGQKKSSGQKSGINDKQSSYNNCNFYLTEIPPSLRDKFGLKSNYGAKDECTEEEATTVCTEETEETEDCTTISRDDEDDCDDDDYESIGRDRDDYRCQGTTQCNQWNPCFPPIFNPFCFPFFPFGMGWQDDCGMGGQGGCGMGGCGIGGQGSSGMSGQVGFERGRRCGFEMGGQGGYGRGGQGGYGRGGQGGYGRGGQGGYGRGGDHCGKGSGVRNGRDGRDRGVEPYDPNRGTNNGRRNGNRTGGYTGNRNPNEGNRNPNAGYGGEGNPYGRYTANDNCNRPSRRGIGSCANMRSNHSIRRVGSKKSTKSKSLKSGTSSRILSRMSGYRPYTYSNKELTKKSSAYLPENYDKPPPHAFNKSIHPSRAPISNYSTYNPTELEMHMAMVKFSEGKSFHGSSNAMRPGQSGVNSLLGPSNATRSNYSGVKSSCVPSNTTRMDYSGGNSNATRTDYNGGNSNATRTDYSGVNSNATRTDYNCGNSNATRTDYSGVNSNATRMDYSGVNSNATRMDYSGVNSNATKTDYNGGNSNATRTDYNGGNSNETRLEYNAGNSNATRLEYSGVKSLCGPSNAKQADYNGENSLLGPSNVTRQDYTGVKSMYGTSNATRPEYTGGQSSQWPSNATQQELSGVKSSCGPSIATRQGYSGVKSSYGPSNAIRTNYNGGNSSLFGPSNATQSEYTGGQTPLWPSNATRTVYNGGNSLVGSSNATQPQSTMNQSTMQYTQHVRFPTTSSKSAMWATQTQMSGALTHSLSEPTVSRSTGFHDDRELVPVYRTSTQTSLQIIDKENKPSEIRVIQRPVQILSGYQTNEAATHNCQEDVGCETMKTGTEDLHNKRKRKKRTSDPCHPPKCLKPHARRLHRLCSITNRRTKRLSQIHKPIFSFEPPPCPIRETFASILRKKPPMTCKMHDVDVPPYHEYCMTNHCPDTNRYPLLTNDDPSENCREDPNFSNQYQGASQNRSGKNARTVHTRGAKRKQHHR